MKKVLFLAQLPPPVHGVTVVSKRVYDMLEQDGGFHVTRRWQGGARSLGDIGTKSIAKIGALLSLAGSLVRDWVTLRRYDVAYLTFTPWSHAALRDAGLAFLARRVAKRVLVHLHTEGLAGVLKQNTVRARLIRVFMRGSELIGITEETAILAEKSGVFSRVNRLPNMAQHPGNRPNRQALKVSTPRAPLRCAYLGNYDDRKGIYDFVDIIARLKTEHIHVEAIIAGGPSRFVTSENLAGYIQERGLTGEITVHGFVSDEEKSALLHRADLFVYPSRHDHAPLVLIEAMAHAAVPLTLDAGGIRSLMGEDLAGNVFDHTASREEAINWFVARIRSYEQERDTLASTRDIVLRRFTTEFSETRFRTNLIAIFQHESGVPAHCDSPEKGRETPHPHAV